MKFQEVTKNTIDIPLDVPDIHGMITREECAYLYKVTSTLFTGRGEIVEVGSWLGRSANYLAAGVAFSGLERKLHCYDDFQWTPVHSVIAKKKGYWDNHEYIHPGQDFLPHFVSNTKKYSNYIIPHKTAIKDINWNGESIEILFLDAPKQFEALSKTFEVFGPYLIPNYSLLIIQDYLYFPAYPIALFCHGLKDYFEPLHYPGGGSTVSFRVKKKIDDLNALHKEYDYRYWTEDRHDEAWDQIFRQLPDIGRERLALGRVLSLYDRARKDESVKILRSMNLSEGQVKKAESVRNTLGKRYPELADILVSDISIKEKLNWKLRRLFSKLRQFNVKSSRI